MLVPNLDPDRAAFIHVRIQSMRTLRTTRVPSWPRADKDLPQVELEVAWLRFSTLNHRTRAEQHREIRRSGREDLFTRDPLGSEGQEAQYRILSGQEGFEDLKADLADRGQQEPTIITADGVLINGNRRSAAMRALYEQNGLAKARYVTCLVLPKDATAAELVDLEAELQVAKDFKQEYSWVNEALLIEELYNREAKDFARVATRMHRKASDLREQYEKIQQVHQLVALSRGAREYVDFVDNESAFDELAKHIKNKPQPEADSVKSVYFLGTLAGVEYRKLRNLRRADASQLVEREIENDPVLSPVLEAAQATVADADPLDDILGEIPESTPLRGMLQLVAEKRSEASVQLADGGEVELSEVLQGLRSAITLAAGEAEEEARDQSAVSAPVKRVDQAIGDLQRARATLPKARAFSEWDEGAFQRRLDEIADVLQQIRAQA